MPPLSKWRMMSKLVNLKGLGFKSEKPSITIARLINRSPMWENQVVFQHGFWDLNQRGYTLYPEDLDCFPWWGNKVESARNKAVEIALARDSDYLVFIDDDMTMAKPLVDVVEHLIGMNKDITSLIGTTKSPPYWPNIVKVVKFGEDKTVSTVQIRKILDAAMMCISKKVLKKMKPPYFYTAPCYVDNNVIGEDNTFCYNAKMNGFEVWVDPTIALFHIGFFGYGVNEMGTCYMNFKDKVIEDGKIQFKYMEEWNIPNSDHSNNLVESVQKEFKDAAISV
jgi:hypothetical protein